MRWLHIGFVCVVLGVVTFAAMPLQWLATRRNWPLASRLPYYWQRLACRMIGLRVRVKGTPAKPPLLIASNHSSWLDITVLGSILPVSYVSKREVASWPVLGTLARLQRSVFIDRTRRTQTASATEAIGRRIGAGETIVLFAEGTTADGNRVLPFRSALLGAAGAVSGAATITVQPVAINYTAIQGVPIGRFDRTRIAWYGDMPFLPHFIALLSSGGIDVDVSFGEPISFGPDYDRKKVAEECFNAVRRMLDASRRAPPLPPPNGHRRPLFSRRKKGAIAAADVRPGPGQSIAGRIS